MRTLWRKWITSGAGSMIALIAGLSSIGTSHAQSTIAYDGFSYGAGPLSGQNGGTGWSNAWSWTYLSGTNLSVSASGFSYPNLSTAGGLATWTSGGNGIAEATRSLPLVNSGVVYIQFLCQFGATSGGGTPNLRLFNGASLTGGFGGNGGTYGSRLSILDSSLQPLPSGSSSSTNLLSALNLVVARIDYLNSKTEMWVNPDLSVFDYLNPTSPSAVYTNLAPAFNAIGLYTRNPGSFDELRVIVVPEPATASFLLTGLALLALSRRKRAAAVATFKRPSPWRPSLR